MNFRSWFSSLLRFLPLPCPGCRVGDGGGRNALCSECRKNCR